MFPFKGTQYVLEPSSGQLEFSTIGLNFERAPFEIYEKTKKHNLLCPWCLYANSPQIEVSSLLNGQNIHTHTLIL